MFILNFYRFFISILFGAIVCFLYLPKWWIFLSVTIITRFLWFTIEVSVRHLIIEKTFKKHATEFRQLYGPYGIRIINKAESDFQIRKSLAEVFTSDINALKKNIEQLEIMDTIFKAGLRPDADSMLLHDLKLKYGKYRIEKSGR